MNFKPVIFLLFFVLAASLLSACATAEKDVSEEVVIEDSSKTPGGEIYITNADYQEDKPQITAQPASRSVKRVLPDKSEIETFVDGFGNKTETRYFPEHSRLRCIILRTSVDGKYEVTVYGRGGDTKIVPELAENALSASGDEIAGIAKLNFAPGYGGGKNYMKRRNTESQSALTPLPSSSFQQPVMSVNQSVETKVEDEKPTP